MPRLKICEAFWVEFSMYFRPTERRHKFIEIGIAEGSILTRSFQKCFNQTSHKMFFFINMEIEYSVTLNAILLAHYTVNDSLLEKLF